MTWIFQKFQYTLILIGLLMLVIGFLLRNQRVERFTRQQRRKREDTPEATASDSNVMIHTKENKHRTPSKELEMVNQNNLDLAQNSNFFYTKHGDSKRNTKHILDLGDACAIQNKQRESIESPITTTVPPAGLSDSVRDKIRRDTVNVVRDEIQSIFKDNTYQYKLE